MKQRRRRGICVDGDERRPAAENTAARPSLQKILCRRVVGDKGPAAGLVSVRRCLGEDLKAKSPDEFVALAQSEL